MSDSLHDACDTLRLLIDEMSETLDCLHLIEGLFTQLLKIELNQSLAAESMDRLYRSPLAIFVKSIPHNDDPSANSRDKHLVTQKFLASKAWAALNHSVDLLTGADDTRAHFIMSLEPLLLLSKRFPSSMRTYLDHCQWVISGRQTKTRARPDTDSADLGAPRPRSQGMHPSQTLAYRGDHGEDDSSPATSPDSASPVSPIESPDISAKCQEPDGRSIGVCDEFSFLPETLTSPALCAYCEKGEPPLVCSDCVIRYHCRIGVATAYCNVDCQARHWGRHKESCGDQMRLYRLVKMVDMGLTLLESETCAVSLRGIRKSDCCPVVELRYTPEDIFHGAHLLRKFPNSQFADLGHEDLAARVFYNGLAESLTVLGSYIAKWLLAANLGIFDKIEQVVVHVKNVQHPLIIDNNQHLTPSGSTPAVTNRKPNTATTLSVHPVFRVTLRNGDVFAVDICGARYGWHEQVMRWDHFVAQRVAHPIAETVTRVFWPEGDNTPEVSHLTQKSGSREGNGDITSLRAIIDAPPAALRKEIASLLKKPAYDGPPVNNPIFAKCRAHNWLLVQIIRESQHKSFLPCGYKFLGFRNRERYAKCYLDFIGSCTRTINAHKSASTFEDWRLYLGIDGRVSVTQSIGDVAHLARVWISRGDADGHDHHYEGCDDCTCANYNPKLATATKTLMAAVKQSIAQARSELIPNDPHQAVKVWERRVRAPNVDLIFNEPTLDTDGKANAVCVQCKLSLCPLCCGTLPIESRKVTRSDLK